jgi:hypothetical protein
VRILAVGVTDSEIGIRSPHSKPGKEEFYRPHSAELHSTTASQRDFILD